MGFAEAYFLPPPCFPHVEDEHHIVWNTDDYPWAGVSCLLVWAYRPYPAGCRIPAYYVASNASYHASVALAKRLEAEGVRLKRCELPIKQLAAKYGVGLTCRNSLVALPGFGTRVVFQSMLLEPTKEHPFAAEEYSNELPDLCAYCRACMNACPAGAIGEGGLDVKKCMRYYMDGADYPDWVYGVQRTHMGCEVCQAVCPRNAHIKEEEPPGPVREAFALEKLAAGDTKPARLLVGKNFTGNGKLQKEAVNFMKRESVKSISPEEAKEEFKSVLRLRQAYRHAGTILSYDSMTGAPANSAAGAARDSALLAGEEFKLASSERFGEILDALLENADKLDPVTLREAETEKRAYTRMKRVPQELYSEHKRLKSEAFAVWKKAKAADDFGMFEPHLDAVFKSAVRIARFAEPDMEPYDYWLDSNEEGASREKLDPFFELIRSETAPLIKAVLERPAPETGFLHGHFPIEKQREFSHELMALMGIDEASCTLGEAEHPYTTFVNRRDVRMTTHYFEDFVTANMFSVIHEGGHALYELNIGEELSGSPLAHGASAGMHESQSRFYENMIGRSEAFSELVLPLLKAKFPAEFGSVSSREFCRAVNRVQPTLKRTEADELTYCLHVMVRYELEKRLMSGELSAHDLPLEWNRLYKEYLGIDVPSDREGCLQDMHWGSGLIGYFPTYALGNAYAAQICAAIRKELDPDTLVREGRMNEITAFLTDRIYRFGRLKTPAELILSCCSEPFDPRYYVDYLKKKYSAVYDLQLTY